MCLSFERISKESLKRTLSRVGHCSSTGLDVFLHLRSITHARCIHYLILSHTVQPIESMQ
jgi:hypothetical protein